jgi:hypothetical protein
VQTELLRSEATLSMPEPKRKRRHRRSLATFQAAIGKVAFDQNIARVSTLTDLYDSLPRAVKARSSDGGVDVLRAAVVLLHASLEDLLRQVARFHIPDGSEDAMAKIPLAGCAPREKFTIGDLARFRGKTIHEVLQESVWQHYASSVTFNSVAQIEEVIERCDLKQERVRRFNPALGEMIARRHHIVHRADVIDRSHGPQSLSVGKVQRWASATRRFGYALLIEMSKVRLVDLDRDAEMLGGPARPSTASQKKV